MAVSGLRIPAFGSAALEAERAARQPSPFCVQGSTIETLFAVMTLDENCAFSTFIDKCRPRAGYRVPFNIFPMGENLFAA